jgi:hypothetical protein
MTFTFTDPRGWQDLDVENILINNFLDGRNACYLAYSQPPNVLYIMNGPGIALRLSIAANLKGKHFGQCAAELRKVRGAIPHKYEILIAPSKSPSPASPCCCLPPDPVQPCTPPGSR